MSDFESMHDLVGAYALDAMDDAERGTFEVHLDECAQCREELASFGGVLDALSDDAGDEVQAPAGLAERIGAQIAITPQVSLDAGGPAAVLDGTHLGDAPVSDGDTANLPRIDADIAGSDTAPTLHDDAAATDGALASENVLPFERAVRADGHPTAGQRTHADPAGRRSRLPMMLASAAAAVAVAAVGIGLLVNGGSPDANVAAVDAVLEATDARTLDMGMGDAKITVSSEAGGFAATGSAPDLATGEEYQLWMVHSDGTVAPGPTFEAGDFQTAVIADMTGVEAIAVSVEPAGGSEQPTTDPITAVQL